MKLKKGLAKEYEEKKEFAHEQQLLKDKHNIEKDVVIVEKSGLWRFLSDAFKTMITIIIFLLTAIGLISLIYPSPRQELLKILVKCFNDIVNFISL